MTHPPPNTKSVEVQARQPQDDDLAQRMSEIELALELLVGDEATHDWLRPPHYHGPQDWSRDARNKEVAANLQHINDLCRDGEAYRAERQSRASRKPRVRPPDGLRTKAAAAAKLGCSIKTLNGHVDAGELRYVVIGHGKKRVRRMFADVDLDEFIANQTRKDSPCPSDATHARRSGNTTFKSEIIAFSEVRKDDPARSRKSRGCRARASEAARRADRVGEDIAAARRRCWALLDRACAASRGRTEHVDAAWHRAGISRQG
jgi:hypothetical protein